MKVYLPFIFSAFVLLSCHKDEGEPMYDDPYSDEYGAACPRYFSISGTVVDSLTGAPVAGVSLFDHMTYPWMFGDTTDANGHFEDIQTYYYLCKKTSSGSPDARPEGLVMSLDRNQDYFVAASPSNYVSFVGLAENSETPEQTIKVVPYHLLSVHVTGTTSGESLSIRPNPLDPGSGSYGSLGTTVDTTITIKVYSNRTTQIPLYLDYAGSSSVPYSVTEYSAGYGGSGTIEIHYP